MLVHGRELHSPVDLLYSGWVEQKAEKQDVSTWAREIAERIDLLREKACLKQLETIENRKEKYDKTARARQFESDDQVLSEPQG